MGRRDDDHSEQENRQEDAKAERARAKRDADIARGFSHNTDALHAHYGHSLASTDPADALNRLHEKMVADLKDDRNAILAQLSQWRGISSMYAKDYRERLAAIDLSRAAAGVALRALHKEVERVPRDDGAFSAPPIATKFMQPDESAKNLRDFATDLRHLIENHDRYLRIVRA